MPVKRLNAVCPECGSGSVVYAVTTTKGTVIKRRHQCDGPHKHRFTTYGAGELRNVGTRRKKLAKLGQGLWKGPILTEWRHASSTIWPVIV